MQADDGVVPNTEQTTSDSNPSIQNSKPKTDENSATGRKWSILIMLLITSTCIVMILVARLSGFTSLHKGYMYGCLFLLMLSGVIIMTCLCCINRCDTKSNEENQSERNSNGNNTTCMKFIYVLPSLILVLLALGSVVQDFMECVELVKCFDVFPDRSEMGWNLAYHVIKIIFITNQAGFICFFRYKRIQCKNWCTRTLLLVIPAANACVWVYISTSELEHLTNKHSTGNNITFHSDEYDSDQCLNRDNEVSRANKASQPYLYPLTIEFCLSSIEMLRAIVYSKNKDSHSDHTNRETEATSQGTSQTPSITSDSHPHHTDRETKETSQGTPQTPPLAPASHPDHTDIDEEATRQGTPQRPPITSDSIPEHNWIYVLNIIFFCVLMLMLLLPGVLGFLIHLYSEYLVPYYILDLLVQIIIFLAASMSWIFLIQGGGCPSITIQFGSDQVHLIGYGCVLVIRTVLELLPSYVYVAQESTSNVDQCLSLLLAADVFLLLSVFLQTSLVLNNHFVLKDEYYQWLKVCFQVLIVCNLYIWFDHSFLAVILNPYKFEKHPLDIPKSMWIFVKLALMPPCIFYRIHFAHICSVKYVALQKT